MVESIQEKEELISKLKEVISQMQDEMAEKDERLIDVLQKLSSMQDGSFETEKIQPLSIKQDDYDINLKSLLGRKEQKISLLMEKVEQKNKKIEEYESVLSEFEKGQKIKAGMILDFGSRLTDLQDNKERLHGELSGQEERAINLMQELKKKDMLIASLKAKNDALMAKFAIEKDDSKKILLEKSQEKSKAIFTLAEKAKELEAELGKKELEVRSVLKGETEKDRLISKLNKLVEGLTKDNTLLKSELERFEGIAKDKSKKNIQIEAKLSLVEQKFLSITEKINEVAKENDSLQKKNAQDSELYIKQISTVKSELLEKIAYLKKENDSLTDKLKSIIKDSAEKEIEFKEKMNALKKAIDSQNYAVLEKEKREKELVKEISSKFDEILELKNKMSEISKEPEFLKLDSEGSYKAEELNNLRAMIKLGLAHGDDIEKIRRSLLSSGFTTEMISAAEEGIEKKNR